MIQHFLAFHVVIRLYAPLDAQTAPTEPEAMPEVMMDFEFVRCSAMEGADAGEAAFFYTTKDDNLMLSVGVRGIVCCVFWVCVVYCSAVTRHSLDLSRPHN